MKEAKALLNRLKQQNYKPIYLLVGETETYFVDIISKYIEDHVLAEDQKSFNLSVLYGKDTKVDDLINYCKRFPMMAPYQVIILREAQDLKQIEKLEAYVENPQQTTILVLCYKYKKVDGRKKIFKTIKSKHEYYATKKLYDNDILAWISSSLERMKFTIDPKASRMLLEFLGNSISKIDKELEKLQQILPQGTTILPKHIEEYVGISKDYNNFELVNAIGRKDEFKAQKIAKYFLENPKNHPFVVTVGMIYSFFNKLLIVHAQPSKDKKHLSSVLGIPVFFVNDYIHACQKYNLKSTTKIISLIREADAQSKGIGVSPVAGVDLLRPLLYKIMRS
jgi:DNA polymerase-3 subunit delta